MSILVVSISTRVAAVVSVVDDDNVAFDIVVCELYDEVSDVVKVGVTIVESIVDGDVACVVL